jgi:hypothetical protein
MLKLLRYTQARQALGLESTPPLVTSTTLKLSDFTRAKPTDGVQEVEGGEAPVVGETVDNECPQLRVHDLFNYREFVNLSPSPSHTGNES